MTCNNFNIVQTGQEFFRLKTKIILNWNEDFVCVVPYRYQAFGAASSQMITYVLVDNISFIFVLFDNFYKEAWFSILMALVRHIRCWSLPRCSYPQISMNLVHRFLEMFMFTSVFNKQISSTHHLFLLFTYYSLINTRSLSNVTKIIPNNPNALIIKQVMQWNDQFKDTASSR